MGSIQIQSTHLKGLDGIRGIAACAVMFNHLEQSRLFFNLPSYFLSFAERKIGALGVTLFFVLSGFLITYLLINEKKESQYINIKNFYLRRILRIWPLYFLLTFLGFFVIPYIAILTIPNQSSVIDHYWQKLASYLILSPHISMCGQTPVPYAAVLWSVGVEEWFYLFWPLILSIRNIKLILAINVSIILCLTLARIHFTTGSLFYLFSQIRFDCMAIGALAAIMIHYKENKLTHKIYEVLINRAVSLMVFFLTVFFFLYAIRFGALDQLVYSTIFGIILINVSFKNFGNYFLNSSILRFLGKISYGLYCFNWITVVLAIFIIQKFFPSMDSKIIGHIMHYLFGVTLTIGFAALSYYFYERPFLRLKQYYSPSAKSITSIQHEVNVLA